MSLLIPFAKSHDGRIVCVDDVDKGLACKCTCISCGVPMVARKGQSKQDHFAHAPRGTDEVECDINYPRSVLWMAAQIFEEANQVALPDAHIKDSTGRKVQVAKNVIVDFTFQASKLGDDGKTLHIELDVLGHTIELVIGFNPLSSLGMRQPQPGNATLNISISDLQDESGLQAFGQRLKALLLDRTDNKSWKSHPRVSQVVKSAPAASTKGHSPVLSSDQLISHELKRTARLDWITARFQDIRSRHQYAAVCDNCRSPNSPLQSNGCKYCGHLKLTPVKITSNYMKGLGGTYRMKRWIDDSIRALDEV